MSFHFVRRTLPLLVVTLLSSGCNAQPAAETVVAQETQAAKAATSSKSGDEILKQFVEECVLIEPGKGEFPGEISVGSSDKFSLPVSTWKATGKFRISQYEVTQELYKTVTGADPSRWKGARNSLEMVSYDDAVQFCKSLTARLRTKGLIEQTDVVRLPTEMEWEYCCRAATTTKYSFGDSAVADGDSGNSASILNEYAWHTGNAAGNDPAVGVLKPNPWKLYDMHGYLWEYVTSEDPSSPEKIIRGGSWRDHHSLLTSTARLAIPSHAMSDAIGFRCVIASE
ncbi:MAG: formylglycine-generating enzyme family protein [Planctomycetaceae bacterium]